MANITFDRPTAAATARPTMAILVALSGAHLLNDLIQSTIPALYPIFKESYALTFTQIGVISLAFQVTSALLQPLLGWVTDKRPWPYAMVGGMCATLTGLLGLAFATSYPMILVAAAMVGLGSAVFHPEATRMARHAAAGQQGFAQGIFQIGGHVGYSAGPLLAAILVVGPQGQQNLAWVSVVALAAMVLMTWTCARYIAMRREQVAAEPKADSVRAAAKSGLSSAAILTAMSVLIALMFAKNAYAASFSSYYTFYLTEKFAVSVPTSQKLLFLYLVVGAVGVVVGGMIGDRIGRKRIIWLSMLGALPAALALPHADLTGTIILGMIASFIMASAFSQILIFAIDLVPHRVGLVGGLFYGLAFGLGGIAAAGLGVLADQIGIVAVFKWCAWLPALGLLTVLLPNVGK